MSFMPSNTYDKPWLTETMPMSSELISNHIITGYWSLYFDDVSLFDEKWTTIVRELKNNNLPNVYEIKCSTNYVYPQMKEKISFRMVVFKCCFPIQTNVSVQIMSGDVRNKMTYIGTDILDVLNYTDRTTIYGILNWDTSLYGIVNWDTSLKSSIPTSRNHNIELINHLHAGYRIKIYSLDDDDDDDDDK